MTKDFFVKNFSEEFSWFLGKSFHENQVNDFFNQEDSSLDF